MESKTLSINKIKTELKNDNISSALILLEDANDAIFTVFKEQRLLLIPSDSTLLMEAYLDAAKRTITDDDKLNFELNYLKFINTYRIATANLNLKIKSLLSTFTNRNLRDFFFLTNVHLEEFFKSAFEDLHEMLKENSPSQIAFEDQSVVSEFGHHVLKGRLNDALFAQLNLVNIFSKLQNLNPETKFIELSDKKRIKKLIKAFNLSSNLNCYQYALDQVSCIEWNINKVFETRAGYPTFEFSIIDIQFQKAREIGMQRELSSKLMGKQKQSWLRTVLENTTVEVFEYAWNYLQEQNQILITDDKEYLDSKKRLLLSLDELDAKDELLVGMTGENIEVLSQYAIVGILVAFTLAAEALKNKLTKKAYIFTYPVLPYYEIIDLIKHVRIGGFSIDEKLLENYICELPLERHLDLFKSPFIKDKSGILFAVEHIIADGWPTWVRVNLMQGGHTADIVGKAWESYIASILKEHHWSNVNQGFTIKKNGKVLTDVDIIAKREDVLLIIQMKVYYGTGISNYEQWKFRKKLEHGVEQVKKSNEAISSDISILNGLFSKKELQEIKRIKPIVMTNSHYFNGWVLNGISIMSSGSLMQIINGATVRFTTSGGEVVEEKKYANSSTLTVDEFLEFIDLPLDWRIGSQVYKTRTHTEKLDHAIFNFPIFENDLENGFF
jgi:hypothetical protein